MTTVHLTPEQADALLLYLEIELECQAPLGTVDREALASIREALTHAIDEA